MNVLKKVLLGTNTILYIQYIDIAVQANVYKLFRQKIDKYSNRYVASDLAEEFLELYKTYRYTPTEEAFNEVYAAIDERAKYSELDCYNSDNDDLVFIAAKTDVELENKLDIIVRPLSNNKAITTIVKNILERQRKA